MKTSMTGDEAVQRARACFLTEDNTYGCAETALIVLQQAYRLPEAGDSAPAMALNGGVAWSGHICGAISGAAMAVGRLAAQRTISHKEAKRVARRLMAGLMAEFQAEFGATNCRDLINLDISVPEQHATFIQSGIWRDVCMGQIEFVVRKLAPLQDERTWDQVVRSLDSAS